MKLARLPVFPNWFPYNDMLLDGHLKVEPYEGCKTRSWNWDYRGPVLFYTSGRTARSAVDAHGYVDSLAQHKVIVGAGELVEVRTLAREEAMRMVCNFNNLTPRKVREIFKKRGFSREAQDALDMLYDIHCFGYIAPLRMGLFFNNLKRFKEPVPFNWPAGPVKPIFTSIIEGSSLHVELKEVGL